MAPLASDAKFQANSKEILPLPNITEFELQTLLSKVVCLDMANTKASFIEAKNNYQSDLKLELRRSLSFEQKLQHRNIEVMKLSNELRNRLLKSRKTIQRLESKLVEKRNSSSTIGEQGHPLKQLYTQVTSTSTKALSVVYRLRNVSQRLAIPRTSISNQTLLLSRLLDTNSTSNESLMQLTESLKVMCEDENTTTEDRSSCHEDFEQENYQSIVETNIALYRKRIRCKHRESLYKEDEKSLAGASIEAVDLTPSGKGKPTLVSLKRFTSTKSRATVHETNLNSLHKKLRINPLPIAIYNNPIEVLESEAERLTLSGGTLICKEKFVESCQYSAKPISLSCSASEVLHLKSLLFTKNGAVPTSENGEDNSDEEVLRSRPKYEDAEVPRCQVNTAEPDQDFCPFHPFQKHMPLHHTHRPSQSILKKGSVPVGKTSKKLLKDEHNSKEELPTKGV